ncbi:alpha/beta fold hydrolase [Amycolatopsis pithecellobii]|uniref:Alpha/beta fold hydrolase n=1 Tax=Amycolatopsis pithecellobii TaxID=664692 RepID=A0A6N7ZCS1_9PSEU|nr:alpha/beta hydrolase [Amycolatopsis pithecellobii]MTD59560.1 alpha/beta fold hydrolase [Amycolatopsis pithecellobii]
MGREIGTHVLTTPRHTTSYLEAGPSDGPLMFFLHGFPMLGATWRPQIDYFAERGWRCIAPDMRGYGGSSIPDGVAAYAISESTEDMVELHDALGGRPAVWVGHDWGSGVVWSIAAGRPERCRAAISLTVPYFPNGFSFARAVPLVDRSLYPADEFPLGQWEYMQFAIDEPELVCEEFAADPEATFVAWLRRGDPEALGKPAFTATVRAERGWFGPERRAPRMERDDAVLSQEMLGTLVRAYQKTGFLGGNRWYANAGGNLRPAEPARDDDRLSLPVLFVHAAMDRVCDTVDTGFADPMRAACDDLTEVTIDAGHWLTLEKPAEVNAAIANWLKDSFGL